MVFDCFRHVTTCGGAKDKTLILFNLGGNYILWRGAKLLPDMENFMAN
jgi:hypothetical protein